MPEPEEQKAPRSSAERLSGHRSKRAAGGAQRVEVTGPTEHLRLIRALVKLLRSTDASDDEVLALQEIVGSGQRPARTGEELLAFFRASPLVGEELDFHRDDSAGRSVDLS